MYSAVIVIIPACFFPYNSMNFTWNNQGHKMMSEGNNLMEFLLVNHVLHINLFFLRGISRTIVIDLEWV